MVVCPGEVKASLGYMRSFHNPTDIFSSWVNKFVFVVSTSNTVLPDSSIKLPG